MVTYYQYKYYRQNATTLRVTVLVLPPDCELDTVSHPSHKIDGIFLIHSRH